MLVLLLVVVVVLHVLSKVRAGISFRIGEELPLQD